MVKLFQILFLWPLTLQRQRLDLQNVFTILARCRTDRGGQAVNVRHDSSQLHALGPSFGSARG